MSFRRNVLANYISQIYVTLIGIFMVPMYLHYMGAEAYGLVGFFSMVQAWFVLLDAGLTPTMARETARFRGGAIDATSLRQLLRALEGVFVLIAMGGALALVFASASISAHWLNVKDLPLAEVELAIQLIALAVALRWVSGLYKSVINGFERLVWMSAFNSTMATARFVLVIPVLIFVGSSPAHFFGYQVLIAVAELLVLIGFAYRQLPRLEASAVHVRWQWQPIRAVLRFSMAIALTSSIWVLVTQTDKLLLSKLLTLGDYGYFSLSVLVASGVMVISGPIAAPLVPRITRLQAEGKTTEVIQLYRTATQWVAAITFPVALMLAAFPEQIILAWTGNTSVTEAAAPVLRLYALGNGILSVSAFPYYLQYAKGDLKLHLLGSLLFVMVLIPLLVWLTSQSGMQGAGAAWLTANAIYFFCWIPFVHQRLEPGLHGRWLLRDLGTMAGLALISIGIIATVFNVLVDWPQGRLTAALALTLSALFCVATCSLGTRSMRLKLSIRKSNV